MAMTRRHWATLAVIAGWIGAVVAFKVNPGPVSYTHLTLPTSDLV